MFLPFLNNNCWLLYHNFVAAYFQRHLSASLFTFGKSEVSSVLENNRWFKSYVILNNSDIHVGTEMPAAPFLSI